MLYNDAFNIIEANTGVLVVEDKINEIQTLATDKMVMQESGFLEVYVDNQAQTPVYFDNLMLTATTGPVMEVNAYYPFGVIIPNLSTIAGGDKYNAYKYNGKELQDKMNLNWLDYGARMMEPSVGRWMVPDPLAENHFNMSPYLYTGNNPILFIDPNGEDWVLRSTEDGVEEYYYDRSVTSQDEVNKKYGEDAGVLHISTGTKIRVYNNDGDEIQYTFVNDAEKNKYGTVLDGDGNTLDNSQIIYGKHYTIFGTTDKSVNAETLHKNYFGSSYIGPNNPKDYRGRDSYQYQPTWSPTEMASYKHDLDYDALGSRGFGGVISPKTKCADMLLIYECKQVLNNPNSSSQERSRARKIIAGFSAVNFVKPAAP